MKVFVVNMDGDTERLDSAKTQLDRFRVAFERFPAVKGSAVTPSERAEGFSRFGWWRLVGWPINNGQLGCAMSHNAVYKKMVREDIPVACVLEDDVCLADFFPGQLAHLEREVDSSAPSVYLLTNYSGREETADSICRSTENTSAEAYVITLAGAKAILKANDPIRMYCDHWQFFAKRGGLNVYQVFPTASIKNGFAFGSHTGLAVCNKTAVDQLPRFKWFVHKCKRCVGLGLDGVIFALTGK